MNRKTITAAAFILTAGVLFWGCGRGNDQEQPLNIVILTLDTTRADHLGCYGHEVAHTPRLDQFAADDAVLYENAIVPVPITLPSHTSIMTGTHPVFHGVHDNDGYYVDDELTTLAEILTDQGWTTGAVVAAFPLDSQFKLDQGFTTYNDDFTQDWTQSEMEARTDLSFGFIQRTADQVNKAAFRWIQEKKEEPFFLWMHYFDPHQSYSPPKPYDSLLANRYDGEIAFVDENFGELIDFLNAQELLENTIIIVVGDHGESLEEHGEPTHATLIYDATMRVPLLISVPGDPFAKGQRVSQQVSTVDLAPTILDLLGITPHPDMQGVSLVPALKDPSTQASLPTLLESHFGLLHFGWAPLRAVRTDDWKYILAPAPELYDLKSDPAELYNLASTRPEIASRMDRLLSDTADHLSAGDPSRSVAAAIDPSVTANLEALGYIGGSEASTRGQAFPSRDQLNLMANPVDHGLVLHYINVSSELVRTRQFEDALSVSRRGLEMDPDNFRMHFTMGHAHLGLGHQKKALAEFEKSAQLNPSDAALHSTIGQIYYGFGQFQEAKSALLEAIQIEPNRSDALSILGLVYAQLGEYDTAIGTLQRALENKPNDWRGYLNLGRVQSDAGQLEGARNSFQTAMTLNPYSSVVLGTIGLFYVQIGNPEFGRTSLEQAHRISPDDPSISFHLAEALMQTDADPALVRDQLERAIALAPQSSFAAKAQQYLGEMDADQQPRSD